MYQWIHRSIHRPILNQVSVEYRPSIGNVLADARSSIGRYIGGVSADISTDTPIGRYSWRSPILHR